MVVAVVGVVAVVAVGQWGSGAVGQCGSVAVWECGCVAMQQCGSGAGNRAGNLLVQVKPPVNRNKLMHCPLACEAAGSLLSVLRTEGLKDPGPQIGSIPTRPYKRQPIPKPYKRSIKPLRPRLA